jgi:hypothetical protein
VTDTLLGNLTPAVTDALDSGLTLGTRIRFEADRNITKVRWRFPDTLPSNTVPWAIWVYNPADETAGDLLGSGSFSATPDAGAWNEVSITPIARVTDDEIVVAVWSATRYVATTNFFGADVPSANGDLTGPIEEVGTPNRRNGRFRSGASLLYPSSGSNKSCYFVDIEVSEAAPVSVDLTSVAFTLAAQALTATPGMVTADLTPAVSTFAAQAVSAVPGPLSMAVTAAGVTFEALAVTPVPGVITVALTPATLTLVALQLFSVSTGFPRTTVRSSNVAESSRSSFTRTGGG